MSFSQEKRRARLLDASAAEYRAAGPGWLQSALVTEQVVDMLDEREFPEMALAREHARKLREAEAINQMEQG